MRSQSLCSIPFLFLPYDADPLARILVLSLFYICLSIYISREWEKLDWHPLNPAFLWSCGLLVVTHLKPVGWKLLLLSSGCTETPALLFCMQYLIMCAPSEAISNSAYKPCLICFTCCFTWLLSVSTSLMRFPGFRLHRSCFLIWPGIRLGHDHPLVTCGTQRQLCVLRPWRTNHWEVTSHTFLGSPAESAKKNSPAGLMSSDRDASDPGSPKTLHDLGRGKALSSKAKFVLSPQLQIFACCHSLFLGENAPLNLLCENLS